MNRLRDVVRSRLLLVVLAGTAGAGAALAITRAGDWRDVVLVLVGGVLTLVAGELTSSRDAARQREVRREDADRRDAEGRRDRLRQSHIARIDETRRYLSRWLEGLRIGVETGQPADPTGLSPESKASLDLIGGDDMIREFNAVELMLATAATGPLSEDQHERLARLRASFLSALNEQERRALLDKPLLEPSEAVRIESAQHMTRLVRRAAATRRGA